MVITSFSIQDFSILLHILFISVIWFSEKKNNCSSLKQHYKISLYNRNVVFSVRSGLNFEILFT